MAESKFVTVVAKSTKQKQRIPRRWLNHPRLGADFQETPKGRAKSRTHHEPPAGKAEVSDQTPTEDTTGAPSDLDHHESPSAGEEE